MASSSGSPCAACKFLRRKCTPECVFAPYFPPDQPQKFANVHKIFGASNVTKLLNDIPVHQREDAVNSLAYEADARVKDPVYGCVGAISILQRQIIHLQKELAIARSELARYTGIGMLGAGTASLSLPMQGSAASTSLGIGMSPTLRESQMITRDHLLELTRDQPLTRDQLLEYARVASTGSYDANTLAALGLTGALQGQMACYSHTRTGPGTDGGSTSSGDVSRNPMGQLSPP